MLSPTSEHERVHLLMLMLYIDAIRKRNYNDRAAHHFQVYDCQALANDDPQHLEDGNQG